MKNTGIRSKMTGKNTGRSKISKKTPEEDLKSPKKHRKKILNHQKKHRNKIQNHQKTSE